ncbi:MAG: hypothetical protein R3217_09375 [Gammaproteobacteria bacterium]|nr:hypothetical protein [Gammaproteobacteria bacterium]
MSDEPTTPKTPKTLGSQTSDTFMRLETASDNRAAAVALAQQASRRISIFSRDLDPAVYDDPAFLDAVRALATRGGQVMIRILLVDATRATKEGHRLIELSRRLSTFVQVRKPHRDYLDMGEGFLIADETGLLYRKLSTRWEGTADTHDPMGAREKLKLFDTIWEKSQPEIESRQLGI